MHPLTGKPLTAHTAPHHTQVKYLTIRCLRTRRFAALSIQRIGEVVFVAILSGLFWFQLGNTDGGPMTEQIARDMGGLLFFMVRA